MRRLLRRRTLSRYTQLTGAVITLVFVTSFFRWVLVPADLYNSSDQEEFEQRHPAGPQILPRLKDAVFDRDALRQADPVVDKIMQISNDEPARGGIHGSASLRGNRRPRQPLIPHILHQTWDSHMIPSRFIPWIQSWIQLHPSWDYWLWTPDAVRCLLDSYYPDYRIYYDEYPDEISRHDMMRYFVLYQFGGFYIDIDTVALKPLDPWTYSHHCLLSEEPYEHTFVVREENRTNVVNSPMAARPRHAFFHQVISSLPEFASRYFGDFLHSTGPHFLDTVYQRYLHLHAGRGASLYDNVTVLNPKYFLPTYDPSQSGIIDDRCSVKTYRSLLQAQRRVCQNLMDREYKNKPFDESYMDHFWIHVNTMDPEWKNRDLVDIFSVLPRMKNLSAIMCDRM